MAAKMSAYQQIGKRGEASGAAAAANIAKAKHQKTSGVARRGENAK